MFLWHTVHVVLHSLLVVEVVLSHGREVEGGDSASEALAVLEAADRGTGSIS